MASNGTLFPKNIFFFSFLLVFLSAYFSFLLNVSFCFSFLNLLSYLFLSHTPLLALIMSFSFHFYNFSFFSLFLMFASTNSFCPQFCFIPSPMSSLFCLFFSFCFSFPFSNRVKVPCFSFFPIPFIQLYLLPLFLSGISLQLSVSTKVLSFCHRFLISVLSASITGFHFYAHLLFAQSLSL